MNLAERIVDAVLDGVNTRNWHAPTREAVVKGIAAELVTPLLAESDDPIDALERELRGDAQRMLDTDRWKLGQLLGAIVEEHGGVLDVDLDLAAQLSGQRLVFDVSEDRSTCTLRLVPFHVRQVGDDQ